MKIKTLHIHYDEHKEFKKLQSKTKGVVKLKNRGTMNKTPNLRSYFKHTMSISYLALSESHHHYSLSLTLSQQ